LTASILFASYIRTFPVVGGILLEEGGAWEGGVNEAAEALCGSGYTRKLLSFDGESAQIAAEC
jgi:hypothetical protein